MTGRVRQLLYISQSVESFTTEVCKNILSIARFNNKRNGITGFLAYLSNDTIIQILEGKADAVGVTYERISKDTRHTSIVIIIDIESQERLFSEWLMGFRMLEQSEVSALPDFVNLRDGGVPKLLDGEQGIIKVLKSIFVVNTTFD